MQKGEDGAAVSSAERDRSETRIARVAGFSVAFLLAALGLRAAEPSVIPFELHAVDQVSGRGVPLVEFRTVHKVSFWTDSAGRVAFDEPGLMDRETYFHVASPGYQIPADAFGNRGIRVVPRAGERAVVRLQRLNIAERLYRITGGGIYRDSLLLGHPSPIREPVLNGLVLGQDTVVTTRYRGRLYWFWGDTDRPSYPLGNFAASGAISDLPGHGGLDPELGINLEYLIDPDSGFTRPMCPDFGRGLHWIESVFTLRDPSGSERLLARVSSQEGLKPAYAWHLAVFDDAARSFQRLVTWDLQEGHDAAHPFHAVANGQTYLYLYPDYRVPADLESVARLDRYEAYTCVLPEPSPPGDTVGPIRSPSTAVTRNAAPSPAPGIIDRDRQGRPRFAWRAGAPRLHHGRFREFLASGQLRPEDELLRLVDLDSGKPVPPGRGSVFWNPYRSRWIRITSGAPGDLWFAEADTPTGPWTYARRVVTHGDYHFYNPTQHPEFDRDHGRRIYFEGTYTAAFSAAQSMTPRYDYNQILYALNLDDPRLDLPVAVYRLNAPAPPDRTLVLGPELTPSDFESGLVEVPFLALPPSRPGPERVALFLNAAGRLVLDPTQPRQVPAFLALRSPLPSEDPARQLLLPLGPDGPFPPDSKQPPLGWVWRNPSPVLAPDRVTPIPSPGD